MSINGRMDELWYVCGIVYNGIPIGDKSEQTMLQVTMKNFHKVEERS